MINRDMISNISAGFILALVTAVCLFAVQQSTYGRPNPAWEAMRIQAQADGDEEILRRLRYVSKAGFLRCPVGSETWCTPSVGVPANCCGEADAYEADEYSVDANGTLYAELTCNSPKNCEDIPGKVHRAPGEKFRVPVEKTLMSHTPKNDTGHGWIWISPSSTNEDGSPVVFCWAPPAGL